MTLPLLAAAAFAAATPRFMDLSEARRAAELRALHGAHPVLADRIAAVSERFLGTPYRLGPLGEGEKGEFDRKPLMSFSEVDCTTFVEEVMALSLEPDLARARELLQRIRYKGGRVAYESRNHFPETDWIPNNVRAGFLKDITRRVAGGRARWASKTIRKAAWYAEKSAAELSGFAGEPPSALEERARRWRDLGAAMPDEKARLPYLPVEDLPALAARIPSGTIANVVRESRPDKPILVTHQLIVLQTPAGPIARHAAFGKRVLDAPLLAYFEGLKGASWRIVGLNLNALVEKRGGK